MAIHFPKKDSAGARLWTTKDADRVFIERDYVRQTEIDEAIAERNIRSCFKACRTCGCCANSRRDCSHTYSFDSNARKNTNCIGCEPHRFHDCHNGFIRDTHGDAEPFTETQLNLIKMAEDGRPLI